jgi:hypothetical protein
MNTSKETLRESIAHQREELIDTLQKPLQQLASSCVPVWGNRERLDDVLNNALSILPYGKSLYAMDIDAVQISDSMTREGKLEMDFARDRSNRPYMREAVPTTGFLLSESYISLRGQRPSLTAIQIVRDAGENVIGFIGTDFDLRDLPLTRTLYEEPRVWRQIKGDPSIRGGVFHQSRAESEMDRHIDTVLGVVEELMVYHGVYHVMLHFSSSRAIIWVLTDPYRYRLLDIEALIDPDSCLAYPRLPYPEDALVPADKIRSVLDVFRSLRFMDEMFYLRSGTLNVFNGIVGLTFSCDGSHYVPYDEFLRMDQGFWIGAN